MNDRVLCPTLIGFRPTSAIRNSDLCTPAADPSPPGGAWGVFGMQHCADRRLAEGAGSVTRKKKRTAAAAAGHLFLGTRNGTRSAADAIAKPPVDRIITGLLTAVVVESQFFFAFAGVGRGNVISVEMLRSSPKETKRCGGAGDYLADPNAVQRQVTLECTSQFGGREKHQGAPKRERSET